MLNGVGTHDQIYSTRKSGPHFSCSIRSRCILQITKVIARLTNREKSYE